MNKENKVRESNYDLLRIIACIAVILIHVNSIYIVDVNDSKFLDGGGYFTKYSFLIVTITQISKFAVPIFVMLSGAFLLSNPKNENVKSFYKKNVDRILIPILIFSIFYILFTEITSLLSGDSVLIPLKNLFLGKPYYHMWYMYMVIGLYIFVPYIVKNISKLNNCLFVCLFIWCALSGATSDIPINYGISKVVTYIGYFLAGYKIRQYTLNKKNNFKGILLILLGFTFEIILSIISFYYGSYLDNVPLLKLIVLDSGHFSLFIIMASLLIFTGFSYLNINMNCSKIANKTFLIYLIHPFVLNCHFHP